jgi:DNA-binding transcriptional LysR family regulator
MTEITDWNKLKVFYSVANAGSFTNAGAKECISPSSLSRQISALEEEIGAPLFHRHARGLNLSERGEVLFSATKEIFRSVKRAEAIVTADQVKPSGKLTVTCSHAFGSVWISPKIPDFLKRYPEVRVNLVLDDRAYDLGMREADCAVRMWQPKQPGLVSNPFVQVNCGFYASKEFCEKYPKIEEFSQIGEAPLIAYSGEVTELSLILNTHIARCRKIAVPNITFSSNNLRSILESAIRGVGIAALPEYLSKSYREQLVPVLQNEQAPMFQTYFVYAEEMRNVKKLTAFHDYLIKCARAGSDL